MREGGMTGDKKEEAVVLDNDVVYEVLRRVDPVTLATASCVSAGFRSMSEDEALWEKFCNSRWPSSREPEVKSILTSVGGYKKLYSECYPLIVNKPKPIDSGDDGLGFKNDAWYSWEIEDETVQKELFDLSASNFISIVDVVYKGHPVLSRTIHGIPGADDFLGWFSNCPFRIDLLKAQEEEDPDRGDREGQPAVVIEEDLPSILSVEKERKDGKFWRSLWDHMRVSWILIDKTTKQMTNLASWRPLGGLRHWPCDEDFLLRFGSILPAHKDSLYGDVQCNIVMKCRFSNVETDGSVKTTLRLTELSMQLEDMGGAHVNGKDSLAILHSALSCPKSKAHNEVLNSYHQYLKVQSQLKEKKNKYEGRLDTAAVVSGIGVFVFICYFII